MRPTLLVAVLLVAVACTEADIAAPSSTATARPSPTASLPPDPFALAAGRDAPDPRELARRVRAVEQKINDGLPVSSEDAHTQQAAYRQLVRTPEWREPAYAALAGPLAQIARANVEAGAELRLLTPPRTELPPWTIVAPPPARELLSHYRAAEREFGIHWTYFAAIHLVETRMGRIRGDSVAGAKGPMQFLPSTWRAYGEGDINDPGDAIRAAARYLRAHGAPDNMERALYAYNHSDHYVRAIELYADRMRDTERAYDAYYGWEVYYRTTGGDALLYVGWSNARPVPSG